MKKRNSLGCLLSVVTLSLTLGIFPTSRDLQIQNRILNNGKIDSKLAVGVSYWWATDERLFYERDLPLFNNASIDHVELGLALPERFPQYDATVDLLIANGIEVLGILQDSRLLSDIKAWGDYVYDTVLHFKDRIRVWEVWNEPNWDNFRGNASGYTEFLKMAYVRAKEADPESFIISGGLLSVDGGLRYLVEMYDNGAQGFMDAVAIHPYCYPASPLEPNRGQDEQTFWELPLVRDLMVERGDENKKIWITEFGYTTPGGDFYVGDAVTVSEADQALYLSQALELASIWNWIERFYIYEWMDSSGEWAYYGLIRGRWNPPYETKPSFDAVKDLIADQNT